MSTATHDALARQWEMLRMIRPAPWKITVRELRERLAVEGFTTTRRTIERDLKELSERFPLASDESSRPYGWSWARDANFVFGARLTTSQAVTLLSARMHLRNLLPRLAMADLWPLFDMAERALASSGWHDWHRRTAIMPSGMPLIAPLVEPAVLDAVHSALGLGRCLEGAYQSRAAGEAKRMKIHPLGLVMRGAAQYLICTLRDYGDIRKLALHRLSDLSVTTEDCQRPEGFNLQDYVAHEGPKYRPAGPLKLKARFAAEAAAHLRDTPLSADQQITGDEGGADVELTATVEDDQTLRWWLLGFGSRVEVLEPAALRAEIADQVNAAAHRYS